MPLLTKILKPEEFNAVTLVIAHQDGMRSLAETLGQFPPSRWVELTDAEKRFRIDVMQGILDDLCSRGILGEILERKTK